MEDLITIFNSEYREKKPMYVKWHQAVVNNDDFSYNIDLGSCASVILVGYDENRKIWFGANHLFKPRNKTEDIALYHISDIYNKLDQSNCLEIACLGVFGAGYKENSLAKRIATQNVMNILEALSFYNLTIEIFETGFSQGLKVIHCQNRKSIMIKHTAILSKETKIIEVDIDKLFTNF